MRTFFQEGDLLVAEVQAFFADGAMSLHTRSLKYGKVSRVSTSLRSLHALLTCPAVQLKNGTLVTVPPSLIVRLKSHFHSLPFGVDLIIGLNGYIWISKTVAKQMRLDGEEVGFGEESGEGVYSSENEVGSPFSASPCRRSLTLAFSLQDISPSIRMDITRTSLIISLLARYCIPISADIITEAYETSIRLVGESPEGLRSLGRLEVGEEVLKALALGRE